MEQPASHFVLRAEKKPVIDDHGLFTAEDTPPPRLSSTATPAGVSLDPVVGPVLVDTTSLVLFTAAAPARIVPVGVLDRPFRAAAKDLLYRSDHIIHSLHISFLLYS
jgi:hypothetical protein